MSVATVDVGSALRVAADRLHSQSGGTIDLATIERQLSSSYDRLADKATITTYLPLMAERDVRHRMRTGTGAIEREEARPDVDRTSSSAERDR